MTRTATFHDLEGASIYITGGGSGIGADLTDGFLAQGAKVAFIGRSDASAFVEAMAEKHGRAPLFLQGDHFQINVLILCPDVFQKVPLLWFRQINGLIKKLLDLLLP